MNLTRTFTRLIAPGILIVLTGCVPEQHYYWGSYQSVLYDMYAEPGSADPSTQVDKITTDIQRAEAEGKPVAPGVYAHLGMMYAELGYLDDAIDAFSTEKALYPESAVLIDGMVRRATTQPEHSSADATPEGTP